MLRELGKLLFIGFEWDLELNYQSFVRLDDLADHDFLTSFLLGRRHVWLFVKRLLKISIFPYLQKLTSCYAVVLP